MITRNLSLPVAISFAIALNASADAVSDTAAADTGLRQEAGRQVREFVTPPGYQERDGLITFEGPGWESNKVAFRLYLDGGNALDIFGKRSPALVLSQVGRGADYHTMSDLGMALFYRSSEIVKTGRDADDDYIVFEAGSSPVYRTGAAWAQESDGHRDVRALMNWLRGTQRSLNKETR